MIIWLAILHINISETALLAMSGLLFFIINYVLITAIIRFKNYKDLRFVSNKINFYIYYLRHFPSKKGLWISLLILPLEMIMMILLIPGL